MLAQDRAQRGLGNKKTAVLGLVEVGMHDHFVPEENLKTWLFKKLTHKEVSAVELAVPPRVGVSLGQVL